MLQNLLPQFTDKKIDIQLECAKHLEINSFPGAISQALTSLIKNSYQHAFLESSEGIIKIDITADDKIAEIKYHDNGIGMSQQESKKVFDPFYTTKRGEGFSGLGMHIVYNLVTQKLLGKISCKSDSENGTTYSITIPRFIELDPS